MGQTLSEPVTAKESSVVQNGKFKVGSSCMQGWRVTMEDAHTHILAIPDDQRSAFFGVYDGHGGSKVALHAGNHLHKYVTQRAEYRQGLIPEAMKQGFLQFDEAMQKDEQMREELAGTTAVTVLIKDNSLYCANVGDSRAVACIRGATEALSSDHKPNNPEENSRICRAGGWVEYNRVNGNLALSRALGDFVFKRNSAVPAEEQMVIAVPDVEVREITEDWEFIILACDGIWDVVTNEEAVEFVRRRLSNKMEPEVICEELMTSCLAPDCQMGGLGCDNMTVVLVCFLHGGTYDELCDRVKQTIQVEPVNGVEQEAQCSLDDDDDSSENSSYAAEEEEQSPQAPPAESNQTTSNNVESVQQSSSIDSSKDGKRESSEPTEAQ